jgi:hypothetical protein
VKAAAIPSEIGMIFINVSPTLTTNPSNSWFMRRAAFYLMVVARQQRCALPLI